MLARQSSLRKLSSCDWIEYSAAGVSFSASETASRSFVARSATISPSPLATSAFAASTGDWPLPSSTSSSVKFWPVRRPVVVMSRMAIFAPAMPTSDGSDS